MRSDSEMPMVEDVCRLQWLDARTCPIVSVALVRAHLPWWQQLIHRFHVWQRNEFQLQIIVTMSMHRADIVIYRNKCKIYSNWEVFCFYCVEIMPELNTKTFCKSSNLVGNWISYHTGQTQIWTPCVKMPLKWQKKRLNRKQCYILKKMKKMKKM